MREGLIGSSGRQCRTAGNNQTRPLSIPSFLLSIVLIPYWILLFCRIQSFLDPKIPLFSFSDLHAPQISVFPSSLFYSFSSLSFPQFLSFHVPAVRFSPSFFNFLVPLLPSFQCVQCLVPLFYRCSIFSLFPRLLSLFPCPLIYFSPSFSFSLISSFSCVSKIHQSVVLLPSCLCFLVYLQLLSFLVLGSFLSFSQCAKFVSSQSLLPLSVHNLDLMLPSLHHPQLYYSLISLSFFHCHQSKFLQNSLIILKFSLLASSQCPLSLFFQGLNKKIKQWISARVLMEEKKIFLFSAVRLLPWIFLTVFILLHHFHGCFNTPSAE